jgi:hypothetical protein
MPWMTGMKTRYLLYPMLSGLAAAAFMLIAIQASGTRADWLQANLFMPGRILAKALFPQSAQAPASPLHFFVEFALNFVFTWIAITFLAYFLDKLAVTLYELTKV